MGMTRTSGQYPPRASGGAYGNVVRSTKPATDAQIDKIIELRRQQTQVLVETTRWEWEQQGPESLGAYPLNELIRRELSLNYYRWVWDNTPDDVQSQNYKKGQASILIGDFITKVREQKRTLRQKIARAQEDALLSTQERGQAESGRAGRGEPELTDGIYRKKSSGEIYKVYTSRTSKRRLAKLLVVEVYSTMEDVDGQGMVEVQRKRGKFVFQGLARVYVTSEEKMTIEEGRKYGRIYGFCIRCGATLTDDGSIQAGIGPICGGRQHEQDWRPVD